MDHRVAIPFLLTMGQLRDPCIANVLDLADDAGVEERGAAPLTMLVGATRPMVARRPPRRAWDLWRHTALRAAPGRRLGRRSGGHRPPLGLFGYARRTELLVQRARGAGTAPRRSPLGEDERRQG